MCHLEMLKNSLKNSKIRIQMWVAF